jgi:hypothetical protein
VRRARGQAGLGILRWRWQLFNARSIEVLDLEATSFFDLSRATPHRHPPAATNTHSP